MGAAEFRDRGTPAPRHAYAVVICAKGRTRIFGRYVTGTEARNVARKLAKHGCPGAAVRYDPPDGAPEAA